jgi:dual-specificity kinase
MYDAFSVYHLIRFHADLTFSDRTVRLLGQGTFGKVVEARDTQNNNQAVAIKIIRAIPKYRDASRIEIRVLQRLKEKDPMNRQYVLSFHIILSY